MVMDISVRVDVRELTRNLGALADKQIPFATAQALNGLGAAVKAAEEANLKKTFPTLTPFTAKSVTVLKAKKGSPTVTILIKDRAAHYLEPYETGGRHVLNSRALLNPKQVPLNQYGNLAKGKLASLKSNPNVFVGTIKTASGKRISGVFLRGNFTRTTLGRKRRSGRVVAPQRDVASRIKILVRFGDALPVKQRLHYQSIGHAVAALQFSGFFNSAMARAMASAKG